MHCVSAQTLRADRLPESEWSGLESSRRQGVKSRSSPNVTARGNQKETEKEMENGRACLPCL
jgi:hypothetical protein